MYPLWKQFCIILLLTSAGAAYSLLSGTAPLPWAEPEIGPGEVRLSDAQALDVIWVDARSREAFRNGQIPGALHFDSAQEADSLLRVLEQWLEKPRMIVVYCADASCGTSQKVADRLRENLPEAEIYSLRGGWQAWVER
jgi:rhodanese-related sulfurtransferase